MNLTIVCICSIYFLLSCNLNQLENCILVKEELPKIDDLQSHLNNLDGDDSVGKVCIKSSFYTKEHWEFQQVIEVFLEEEIPFNPEGMPKNSFPSEFGFDLRERNFEDMVTWKEQFEWDSLKGIAIILDSVFYDDKRGELMAFISSLVMESGYIENVKKNNLSSEWIWIRLFVVMHDSRLNT